MSVYFFIFSESAEKVSDTLEREEIRRKVIGKIWKTRNLEEKERRR